MRISKYILAALLGALCLSAAAQSRRDIAALDSLAAVSDSAAVRGLVLRKATLLRRMYCFADTSLSELLRLDEVPYSRRCGLPCGQQFRCDIRQSRHRLCLRVLYIAWPFDW